MVNNHWYYKGTASEYASFDFRDYIEPVRWNHDNTEWVCEHTGTPIDTSRHLTSEQIKGFIMGPNWGFDETGDPIIL